jgi:hypothetical protein
MLGSQSPWIVHSRTASFNNQHSCIIVNFRYNQNTWFWFTINFDLRSILIYFSMHHALMVLWCKKRNCLLAILAKFSETYQAEKNKDMMECYRIRSYHYENPKNMFSSLFKWRQLSFSNRLLWNLKYGNIIVNAAGAL